MWIFFHASVAGVLVSQKTISSAVFDPLLTVNMIYFSLCFGIFSQLLYTRLSRHKLESRVQRAVSAGIPSGQRESCVLRTFLAAFASLAFDPSQPSLVKEHNPPNMDLNKQCNP